MLIATILVILFRILSICCGPESSYDNILHPITSCFHYLYLFLLFRTLRKQVGIIQKYDIKEFAKKKSLINFLGSFLAIDTLLEILQIIIYYHRLQLAHEYPELLFWTTILNEFFYWITLIFFCEIIPLKKITLAIAFSTIISMPFYFSLFFSHFDFCNYSLCFNKDCVSFSELATRFLWLYVYFTAFFLLQRENIWKKSINIPKKDKLSHDNNEYITFIAPSIISFIYKISISFPIILLFAYFVALYSGIINFNGYTFIYNGSVIIVIFNVFLCIVTFTICFLIRIFYEAFIVVFKTYSLCKNNNEKFNHLINNGCNCSEPHPM